MITNLNKAITSLTIVCKCMLSKGSLQPMVVLSNTFQRYCDHLTMLTWSRALTPLSNRLRWDSNLHLIVRILTFWPLGNGCTKKKRKEKERKKINTGLGNAPICEYECLLLSEGKQGYITPHHIIIWDTAFIITTTLNTWRNIIIFNFVYIYYLNIIQCDLISTVYYWEPNSIQ